MKLLIAVMLAATAARAEKTVLAVVVDKDNPKAEISTDELRAVFLGQQKEWTDGARAVPLDLPANTPERDLFNTVVLDMDQGQVDRFWVDQRVRGTGTAPRVAPTPGSLVKLAGKVRGLVAYVPLNAVDASVKVLKVNGVAPGKPGYPLTEK
jgi:ABC-type phosphate transport system substrate-binding protein